MRSRSRCAAPACSPAGALRRNSGPAALVIALLALVMSMTGLADAARHALSGALKPGAAVRLDKDRKIPVAVLPAAVVRTDKSKHVPAALLPVPARALDSDRISGRTAGSLSASCPTGSVDFGTWCLGSAAYAPTDAEVGKTNYFFASQKCAALGGWLPTAAQLIGSAPRVKLASLITDSPGSASIDADATDGLKDKREMSSTLVTTAAGSSAAGSEGVSAGSRGDPRVGEPDPAVQPANPSPDTLQYVTVYDNGDNGGFAGSVPVLQPSSFRCAFNKTQGGVVTGG
jgi:hypothetical protein